MLELKEEREIVRGILNYLESKYDNIKEVFIEQKEKEYSIKVETEDDRSIVDKFERSTDKFIDKCGILFHINNKEVPINFV